MEIRRRKLEMKDRKREKEGREGIRMMKER
jgi:hypothetical protein